MGFKLLLASIICLSVTSATFAHEENSRSENSWSIQAIKMNEIDFEKKQVEMMIKRLSASGRFSSSEANKALRSIASIKEKETNELNKEVLNEMKPNPVAKK